MNMSNIFCIKKDEKSLDCPEHFQKDKYDLTLVCDDKVRVETNRGMLSANSQYFMIVLKQYKQEHPVIRVARITSVLLRDILDFIYKGLVLVPKERLEQFVHFGKKLKLKDIVTENYSVELKTNEQDNIVEKSQRKENRTLQHKIQILEILQQEKQKPAKKKGEPSYVVVYKNKILSRDELHMVSENHFTRSEINMFCCKHCTKTAAGVGHMKEHVQGHLSNFYVRCRGCGITLKSTHTARNHSRLSCKAIQKV